MRPGRFALTILFSTLLCVAAAPEARLAHDPAGIIQSVDSLEVRLLFNGAPLLSKKRAGFSCFSYSQDKWISCQIRPADGLQRYMMRRPYAGRYRMHIRIDEDEGNPDSYAGDYVAIHYLEIGPDFGDTLPIDVPRLIHLTWPVDNDRSVEGAFGACGRSPDYTVPFLSWPHAATVDFSWDPIVDQAAYHVTIARVRCDPYERLEIVETDETDYTSATFQLPPNAEGEHYQFAIGASRNGRDVGVLYIHDAGTHGWDYRFRVGLEEPNPKVAVVASLGAVFLFFLVALAFMLHSGNRSLAAASLFVLVVSGWVGYQAYDSYREAHRLAQNRTNEAQLTAAELQRSLNELFVGEWLQAVPHPAWWDDVTPPDYQIDNVGELMSAWQSDFGRGKTRVLREREFFKGAYLAIVEHPGDRDLTSTAIDLMAFIGRDYPNRREMLELAVKHFFDFEQRTDNCANCMIGDRSNSFVEALADDHVKSEEYSAAIELVERFKRERRKDVSDYAWAETVTVLGQAYWKSGQRIKAVDVMRQEAAISGDHPWIEAMKKQLKEYERELNRPSPITPRPVDRDDP